MTLEEKIALMLQQEAAELEEAKKEKKMEAELDKEDSEDDEDEDEELELDPKMKKDEKAKCEDTETTQETEVVAEKKETVSEQVSTLLATEGLSEDFRTQAVAIFEAAVSDRVSQIQEEMEKEYEQKLNEAKEELSKNIDGYLSESVLTWANENKVPLVHSFKADLAESFIDGLRQLFVEHNVVVPEESEDALNIALEENEKLEAKLEEQTTILSTLQEEINTMKKASILESFKSEMTQTQADRFATLVESIEFSNVEQYKKQLQVVKENFVLNTHAKAEEKTQINEETKVVDSVVNQYASFLTRTIK